MVVVVVVGYIGFEPFWGHFQIDNKASAINLNARELTEKLANWRRNKRERFEELIFTELWLERIKEIYITTYQSDTWTNSEQIKFRSYLLLVDHSMDNKLLICFTACLFLCSLMLHTTAKLDVRGHKLLPISVNCIPPPHCHLRPRIIRVSADTICLTFCTLSHLVTVFHHQI